MDLLSDELARLTERLQAISDRYAETFGIDKAGDWLLLKVQEEMGELTQAYLAATGRTRRDAVAAREDFALEMADVFCQLLLLAKAEGVDLVPAIQAKWLRYERPTQE